MRVRVLGPVAAGPDDGPLVEPPGQVPSSVLAHLALARGHVLSPEGLADSVWDEHPDNIRNALQAAVSRLRRAYGDDVVLTSRGGYRLGDDVVVDADLARSLLEASTAGDVAAGAHALELWQGEPLAGLTSAASDVARRSLDELRGELVASHAENLVRRGRAREALPLLTDAAARSPYDEPLHAQLMRALVAAGRPGDALTEYDRLRHRLSDELGIDPSPEVASTFAAILSGTQEQVRAQPSVSEPRLRTVLLTDVVGSARLWREHPEVMPGALLVHHDLVASTAARHGGTLPPDQGEGDGRMVVFATSADAVGCALDLQRALAEQEWPHGLRLHVRAALARGELVEAAGNEFGPAVPQCARLRSLAHGDQLLLTADVATDLPEAAGRWRLRPLGRVPLRDFGDADVLQLDDPSDPRDFPALRTAVRLPARTTPVLGREQETAALTADVRSHRLVTVTGLGGSGKTTTAVAVARGLVPEFPDGVVFVDLSMCEQLPDARAQIGAVLVGAGSSSTTDALRALGPRTLLLLDNVEQLADGDVLVAGLLEETTAHLLVTSRVPVGAAGEVVRPLGPLDEGDAVALLAQRAAEQAPGRDADRDALVRLARGVGCVPLALELAAGRLRVVGADELADSLDERLGMLSTTRGRPERQRAIETLLADTWDSLSDGSQLVLLALSLSRAAADPVRVSDLTGLPIVDAADALDDLVSRGLVLAHGAVGTSTAFTVLELIRRHALGAAAPDEVASVARRHAAATAAAIVRRGSRTVADQRDDVLEAVRTVGIEPSAYDVDVRIPLARAALWLGRWDDVVALLDGAEGPTVDNLLGVALVRGDGPDDVARGRELLRRAADAGDADAAASLGGSLRAEDPSASYAWYLRALELDPTDPYALGNVLEHELVAAGEVSPLAARHDALVEARERRREQLERAEDLPWSAYDLARLAIWLGDDDALHHLLEGVATSTSVRQIETTLASFRRLATEADDTWRLGTRVLEVALRSRTVEPRAADAVLVLAGASAESTHERVMEWAPVLVEALRGTRTEIVSGGTDRGVSALAAQVAAEAGLRSVGWLPGRLPARVGEDPAYDELRRTEGLTFTLREPLAYWSDLLDRGVDPSAVHVLGLGGGPLTALELHLAEVLGAAVARGPLSASDAGEDVRGRSVERTAASVRAWLLPS